MASWCLTARLMRSKKRSISNASSGQAAKAFRGLRMNPDALHSTFRIREVMLNISNNTVQSDDALKNLKSSRYTLLSTRHLSLRNLLLILLGLFLIFMFLPWTQNVRSDGKVTTL